MLTLTLSLTSARLLPPPRRWVRWELHQWVYANVASKWHVVLRRPGRLPDMFSGYKASRALVWGVLAQVGRHAWPGGPAWLTLGGRCGACHLCLCCCLPPCQDMMQQGLLCARAPVQRHPQAHCFNTLAARHCG